MSFFGQIDGLLSHKMKTLHPFCTQGGMPVIAMCMEKHKYRKKLCSRGGIAFYYEINV